MAKTKEITIIQYRSPLYSAEIKTKEITGTLIPANDKIKSAKALVKALNNAENNKARNGYSGTWYEVKEVEA